MSKGLKKGLIILGVLVALVLVLGAAWLAITRRSFPQTRGSVTLRGLSAPVEIYRDPYGVPHIYAQTTRDLFFAQGYVHAQDRFWQMEFWRRIGAGRLSEYFGEATLGTDMYLRTVGFARLAVQEFEQADPDMRQALEAYADGVNAYILNRPPARLALEFALLQLQGVEVQIEPWTPVNTLTWAKIMSQDLGGNMNDELYAVDLIRTVGLEQARDFVPPYRSDFPVIVPDAELDYLSARPPAYGAASSGWPAYLADLNTDLIGGFDGRRGLALGSGAGIGSNSWVLSGERTATGMPLLANDPHLGIQMPSIWYEVGLHCVEKSEACPYDVRGYSFAGAPGVIIGHNDRIAWGFTNVGPDVQDLYIERINPANPDQYEVNGQWVDMDIVYETIEVNGRDEPVVLRVRSTRHGPIITDLDWLQSASSFNLDATPQNLPERLTLNALALRWTALQPNTTFAAVLMLDRARNFEEFREALRYFDAPSQNVIYADVDGNIGYQTPGLIPIRACGDGSLPVPGWTDDCAWTGYIPYDELPRAFNPEQGYIVTANNPVVSDSYPYLIATEFDHGYRASRIVAMIESRGDGLTIADMQAMQADGLNLSALEIIPYLEGLTWDDPSLSAARDRLLAWDGQMHMDSPDAALYGFFWVALVAETFHDELPEDMWPDGDSRTQDAIYHLLDDPRNAWWDDRTTPGVTETRDDILTRAFEQGYAAAVEALGSDPARWRWGDVHTATFANQTFGQSGIAPIEALFNRGPVAASGGADQVNNTSWSTNDPFNVETVPSMRQIIDLSDLSRSLMMHTTGQSGHPFHRHYADFIDPWRLIDYHPTLWDRADVERQAREHLTLLPAD